MIKTLFSLIIVTAAFGARAAFASGQPELRVLTHDSFSIRKAIIEDFEKANNIRLRFITGGDAGETLNKAILSKDNPIADVIFGIDNTFAGRALDTGILDPYASPLLDRIPADLRIDSTNRLLPVDFGYVCIIYDIAFFRDKNLDLPQKMEDLITPEYRGLLVVENPATSSPGLAFLLATVSRFGVDGDATWEDYWKALRRNDVLVVNGWSDAYYEEFSAGGKGRRPIMVSYATDPAADIFFASDPKPETPRVGTISPEGESFRQIEFVGILRGAKSVEMARKWVDYMLSVKLQEDIPLQMFVYPANKDAALPDLFQKFAPVPPSPAVLDPVLIGRMRDSWINRWTEIVLR
jgi:thiamine transport system substrate-binding protein